LQMFSSYPLEGVPWLLGAVLNVFAGILNILTEAVGRVATDAENSHEGSD